MDEFYESYITKEQFLFLKNNFLNSKNKTAKYLLEEMDILPNKTAPLKHIAIPKFKVFLLLETFKKVFFFTSTRKILMKSNMYNEYA